MEVGFRKQALPRHHCHVQSLGARRRFILHLSRGVPVEDTMCRRGGHKRIDRAQGSAAIPEGSAGIKRRLGGQQ
jgi:hypothetical protein